MQCSYNNKILQSKGTKMKYIMFLMGILIILELALIACSCQAIDLHIIEGCIALSAQLNYVQNRYYLLMYLQYLYFK